MMDHQQIADTVAEKNKELDCDISNGYITPDSSKETIKAAILEALSLANLPPLEDVCVFGHARHGHEYGAFGYNAASNCKEETCPCPWFEMAAPKTETR